MRAADLPQAYVDRINDGDARLLSELFAPDALFRGPSGQLLRGRAAVCDFYAGMFGASVPTVALGRTVIEDGRAVFELVDGSGTPDLEDPAMVVDIIEVDGDGQITRFDVFLHPRTNPPPVAR